jgi:glycosyltransferase involved in cell wall biosynthesis
MACGAIPISNFVGNISDLIKDQENGIRLEGTLSKDIANTFIKVKKMKPDELDNIRSKARLTIEQFFSYDIACREWKKLFDNEVS